MAVCLSYTVREKVCGDECSKTGSRSSDCNGVAQPELPVKTRGFTVSSGVMSVHPPQTSPRRASLLLLTDNWPSLTSYSPADKSADDCAHSDVIDEDLTKSASS